MWTGYGLQRWLFLDTVDASGMQGNFYLENLTEVVVNTAADALTLYWQAMKCKAVAAHDMSDTSSRSHVVLQLAITSALKTAQDEQRHAKLVLVDLAGCERQDQTGIQAKTSAWEDVDASELAGRATQTESIAINRSLMVLRQVIAARSAQDSARGGTGRCAGQHVPYRDSKLTSLLKEGLSGGGRMLMLACIAPSEKHREGSINSLQFTCLVSPPKELCCKHATTHCSKRQTGLNITSAGAHWAGITEAQGVTVLVTVPSVVKHRPFKHRQSLGRPRLRADRARGGLAGKSSSCFRCAHARPSCSIASERKHTASLLLLLRPYTPAACGLYAVGQQRDWRQWRKRRAWYAPELCVCCKQGPRVQARSIRNTAKVNEDSRVSLIRKLRGEIAFLKQQLAATHASAHAQCLADDNSAGRFAHPQAQRNASDSAGSADGAALHEPWKGTGRSACVSAVAGKLQACTGSAMRIVGANGQHAPCISSAATGVDACTTASVACEDMQVQSALEPLHISPGHEVTKDLVDKIVRYGEVSKMLKHSHDGLLVANEQLRSKYVEADSNLTTAYASLSALETECLELRELGILLSSAVKVMPQAHACRCIREAALLQLLFARSVRNMLMVDTPQRCRASVHSATV
jgi:hypothetical protein